MKNSKINKLIVDIYTEVYFNSTPSADFKELMDNAEINGRGQKVIKFDDYVIDETLFNEIVDRHLDKSNFFVYIKKGIKNSLYLGAMPRFTPETNELK